MAKPARDQATLDALTLSPGWLSGVTSRLSGYPDPGTCWVWLGSVSTGYGQVALPHSAGPVRVHRAVWLALVGPIPEGLVLDHDGPTGCSNRACANPAHLQVVTSYHNTVWTGSSAAHRNAAKTHCPKGHPLDSVNNVGYSARRGTRRCRVCHRTHARMASQVIKNAREFLGLSHRAYRARYGESLAIAEQILTHQN